ncbi:hypothetical protein B0H14DRAFT_2561010 [Mycena olivaceomarginata]|nr:hypothetical protein B0H14DRAFT_2561010 [Mycena olivaceomarginata]
MRFVSAIFISSALMWGAYTSPLPQVHNMRMLSFATNQLFIYVGKEAGGLSSESQPRSGGEMDVITELDLVVAREQLQELDARELVKGDAEEDSQSFNARWKALNDKLTEAHTPQTRAGGRECGWHMRDRLSGTTESQFLEQSLCPARFGTANTITCT